MVSIRAFREEDLDSYLAIQNEEWDESMSSTRARLEHRFATFPQGMISAVNADDVVVGCATFILLDDYDVRDKLSWEDLTDDGWCSTHRPSGDTLFGVDLSMSRRAPRSALYLGFLESMQMCLRFDTEGLVWGGRMPRYHRYADVMSPDEYLTARNSRGRYLDPEVELYSRYPGVEILGVVENYFKDWESVNCGVMLRWKNPLHHLKVPRRLHASLVAGMVRRDKRRRANGR